MEKQTFQVMIERRGYQYGVRFVEENGGVSECVVGDHEATTTMLFDGNQFAQMTYQQACERIDDALAEGLIHVVHPCGQVLLEAPFEWSGMGPYSDLDWGFYLVPLEGNSKSVSYCPRCGGLLDYEGGEDEDYEEGSTIYPRVNDPEIAQG